LKRPNDLRTERSYPAKEKKEGALAWDREPQRSRSLGPAVGDCKPMGSSILASLSEAGGNDPFLPISGPLPPHVPVGADRVGTRPTLSHMQLGGPSFSAVATRGLPIFNNLTSTLEWSRGRLEPARNQFGNHCPESVCAVPSGAQKAPLFRLVPANSLFGAHSCGIIETHLGF
jgi:hypothetical protein